MLTARKLTLSHLDISSPMLRSIVYMKIDFEMVIKHCQSMYALIGFKNANTQAREKLKTYVSYYCSLVVTLKIPSKS